MKREFLEELDIGEGVKLSKAAVDAIMPENGKDIKTKVGSGKPSITLTPRPSRISPTMALL